MITKIDSRWGSGRVPALANSEGMPQSVRVTDLWAALSTATFAQIAALSLAVSVSATAAAALVGLPCGAALAIYRFPGRRLLILLTNAFLGLPPVVVGLGLYLTLSRSGAFGALALLFTPSAMVVAQALLAAPIITALAHRAIENPWEEYGGALRIEGATRLRSIRVLLAIGRRSVLTAVLPDSVGRFPRLARC